MKYRKLFSGSFIGLACLLTGITISAQPDYDLSDSQILYSYFDEVYGADEKLVSGPFYYGAITGSIEGHPYFIDEEWKPGYVKIGDIRYDNLLLKYDINIDKVILKYIASNSASFQVGLRSGNITRFTMGDHTFIPYPEVKDSTTVPFAELLSDGEIKYLLVRKKFLMLTNGSGMTDYTYKETVKQYFYRNNELIPFKGRRTLLELYPELKTELKQYARKKGLELRPKKTDDRAEWVNYCNYLLKSGQ